MVNLKMGIKENLAIINDKINQSVIKSHRKENSVKLMAVSKFHPIDAIQTAIDAGQTLFGENRVQEARQKFEILYNTNKNIELNLIGQLQSNKVKDAVKYASCIQSVDRIKLLQEIEKQCIIQNKKINVLFELHTAEDSKSGFESVDEIDNILSEFDNHFSHIIPCGFMTMAPFTDDEKLIRKSFITLRNAKEYLQNKYNNYNLSELSMGMSNDFEIAIQEGSTLVRIGTAIFGERQY